MSKLSIYVKYRDMQIIKHALQYYITRPNATSKEIKQEQAVLGKVEEEIRSELARKLEELGVTEE